MYLYIYTGDQNPIARAVLTKTDDKTAIFRSRLDLVSFVEALKPHVAEVVVMNEQKWKAHSEKLGQVVGSSVNADHHQKSENKLCETMILAEQTQTNQFSKTVTANTEFKEKFWVYVGGWRLLRLSPTNVKHCQILRKFEEGTE